MSVTVTEAGAGGTTQRVTFDLGGGVTLTVGVMPTPKRGIRRLVVTHQSEDDDGRCVWEQMVVHEFDPYTPQQVWPTKEST